MYNVAGIILYGLIIPIVFNVILHAYSSERRHETKNS